MTKVAVVSGYVPIPNHPRTEKEYHQLGAKLLAKIPVNFHMTKLEDTWLWQLVQGGFPNATHAVSDNPAKNTLAYHCVQHQKTTWMLETARRLPQAEVLVWIDYGILHQPGVTVEAIQEFLERVKGEKEIAIPGAWHALSADQLRRMCGVRTVYEIGLENPCWRFCGSTLVSNRAHIESFDSLIRDDVTLRLEGKERSLLAPSISWEINAWSRVEIKCLQPVGHDVIDPVPIRWYQGDHNETQFTNYQSVP